MWGIVSGLQEKELVLIEQSDVDARAKVVRITSVGRRLCRIVDSDIRAHDERLMACLSVEERETLIDLLSRVYESVARSQLPAEGVLRCSVWKRKGSTRGGRHCNPRMSRKNVATKTKRWSHDVPREWVLVRPWPLRLRSAKMPVPGRAGGLEPAPPLRTRQ